jgi:hypothetical protein
MLRRAIADMRARGFAKVNALASTDAADAAMDQFTGPLALYLSEGFVAGDAVPGSKRVRVSLALDA